MVCYDFARPRTRAHVDRFKYRHRRSNQPIRDDTVQSFERARPTGKAQFLIAQAKIICLKIHSNTLHVNDTSRTF